MKATFAPTLGTGETATSTDTAEPGPLPDVTSGTGKRPVKALLQAGDSHDGRPGVLVAVELRGGCGRSPDRRSGRPRRFLAGIRMCGWFSPHCTGRSSPTRWR